MQRNLGIHSFLGLNIHYVAHLCDYFLILRLEEDLRRFVMDYHKNLMASNRLLIYLMDFLPIR